MKIFSKLLILIFLFCITIACDNELAYDVDDLDTENTRLYNYLLELEKLYGKINVKTSEMEEKQRVLEERINTLQEELEGIVTPEDKETIIIKIEEVQNQINQLGNEEELKQLKFEVESVKANVRGILENRKKALEEDKARAKIQQEKDDIQKEIDKVDKQLQDLDNPSGK